MPNNKKPTDDEAAEADLPVPQHLHAPDKQPLKAPIGGVPQNLPRQFPGKGGKNFNQLKGKGGKGGRDFRHQGR